MIEQEVYVKDMDEFIQNVIDRLRTVNPVKIILFGSVAKGERNSDSDIDLVVILDSEKIPDTYDEKLALKVQVRDCIYDLSRQMPIDLVVYTAAEFRIIQNRKTSFYNEIMDTGKVMYEKAS